MAKTFKATATEASGGTTLQVTDSGNTNTIREIGIFNASSNGTMLGRILLPENFVLSATNIRYRIQIELRIEDV